MAERMSTATRMDRARANGKVTRVENGHLKRKARQARDKRMHELLAKGTFPYTPGIMSWVSVKLAKPTTQITADDVKSVAHAPKAG